ncbi:oligosaccharide flippase family protein, partial [Enterococcus faecalis]|nr:oligosaccharide flippase family protein [Enterococcus faecalis]
FAYIKFYVRESQKENAHIRVGKLNGIYLLLFTGISILTLIIGSLLILNKERLFSSALMEQNTNLVSQLMIIMSINIAITFFSSIFDAYIAANEQFKFQQSRQLLQTILFPLLTIPLLTQWHSNAVIIVLIQTMISIFVLSSNISFCKRKLSMAFSFTNLEFSMFKEIGVFSFFIFLNQIFNQINDTAPPLIIGSILGSKQVAIYAIVNQLKSLFFLLSQSFTNIFIPQVNKIVHTNNDSMQLSNVMIKIGKIQVLVLSFFIGGFILLGKYFLLLWLGRGFELAYYLLISVIFPLMIPLSQNIGLEIQQARNKHMFRSIILTIFA